MPVKFNGKQLEKINFCKKEEYDFYEIEIPVKFFFSNKCKKFIYSELVKRHPCFSDDYCFDVKFCLKKKKIFGMVVVIHKFVLAKLHRENFDRCLRVSEIPNRRYFAVNNYGVVFILLALFVVLGSILIFEKKSKKESHNQPLEIYESKIEVSTDSNKPLEKTMKLLQLVKEKSCLVSCFVWESDGFNEKVSVSLENAYPEKFYADFPDAKYSTVTYEQGIPLMQIDLRMPVYIEQNFNESEYVFDSRDKFRKVLLEQGVCIREESVTPYRFLFEFEDCNYLENKLYNIFDFIIENELSTKRVRMQTQNTGFIMDIEFSQVPFFSQFELYSFFMDSEGFFSIKKSNTDTEKNLIGQNNRKEESFSYADFNTLGIIKKPNGNNFEYYKDNLGKIQKRRVTE